MLRSIVTFSEFNWVWSAVRLFPARSKAVMLNDTSPSVLSGYTFTLAFATVPFTSITYVEPKIVMFASLSISSTVIVMFRILFMVARDTLALLLYMVRFSSIGLALSIMTFDEFNWVWFVVRLFPARSNAVMLNDTSPEVLSEYTFTLAFATVPFTSITYVEPKIVMFAPLSVSFAVIVMFSM